MSNPSTTTTTTRFSSCYQKCLYARISGNFLIFSLETSGKLILPLVIERIKRATHQPLTHNPNYNKSILLSIFCHKLLLLSELVVVSFFLFLSVAISLVLSLSSHANDERRQIYEAAMMMMMKQMRAPMSVCSMNTYGMRILSYIIHKNRKKNPIQ